MKYNLLLLFSLLSFSIANAQDLMTVKSGKQYSATPIWNFICENYAYDSDLEVQIAKTETGGILRLAIAVSNNNLIIAGRTYIILDNGSFIYCSDKGIREYKDGQSIAYYNLSPVETSKLKTNAIENIRFRILGKTNSFSSDSGYFTATNKKQLFDPFDKSSNKLDTKTDVKMIFKAK
jgi:hypothetical protein